MSILHQASSLLISVGWIYNKILLNHWFSEATLIPVSHVNHWEARLFLLVTILSECTVWSLLKLFHETLIEGCRSEQETTSFCLSSWKVSVTTERSIQNICSRIIYLWEVTHIFSQGRHQWQYNMKGQGCASFKYILKVIQSPEGPSTWTEGPVNLSTWTEQTREARYLHFIFHSLEFTSKWTACLFFVYFQPWYRG